MVLLIIRSSGTQLIHCSVIKGIKDNIILVDRDKIISEDTEVAQKINDFFKNCVNSLKIAENKLLLTETRDIFDNVDGSIKKNWKPP